jgi:hypothetical protein
MANDVNKAIKTVVAASGTVGIGLAMVGTVLASSAMRLPSSTHLGIHRSAEIAFKELWEWAKK